MSTTAQQGTAEATTTGGRRSLRVVILVGLAISALLAGGLSMFASSHPDGLEFVAEKLGFDGTATSHGFADSPLAEYGLHGVGSESLSGSLAGLIGIAVVAVIAFGLMWLLRRRTPSRTDD